MSGGGQTGGMGSLYGGDPQCISLSSSMVNLSDATTDEPRTVLRVIVENMVYTISLDTLKAVSVNGDFFPVKLPVFAPTFGKATCLFSYFW